MHATDETWLHLPTFCLTEQHPGRMWHQALSSSIQWTLYSFSDLKKQPLVLPSLQHQKMSMDSHFNELRMSMLESEIPLPLIYTVNSSNFCILMKSRPGTVIYKILTMFPLKILFAVIWLRRPQQSSIPLSGHQGLGKVISQIFGKTLLIAFLMALN